MAQIIQREGNIEVIFIYIQNLHLNENACDALRVSEHWMSFSEPCSRVSRGESQKDRPNAALDSIALSMGDMPETPEPREAGRRRMVMGERTPVGKGQGPRGTQRGLHRGRRLPHLSAGLSLDNN